MASPVASWSPDRYDVPYLERHTANIPAAFLPLVGERYRHLYREQGQQAANNYIREEAASLTDGNLRLAASDDEIRQEAKRIANLGRLKLSHQTRATDAAAIRAGLTAWAREHHAVLDDEWTLAGLIARLTDESFWRRQLRRAIGRAIEGHAIAYGLVHRRAGLYASDDTVKAWGEQRRRNAAALANVMAENEEGYTASLAELAAAGVANPTNRRHELMTRLRGFEDWAKEQGDDGLFVTWTLPSAYHARHHESGEENKRYRGHTPKEGAALLSKQWAKARAKLHRMGAAVYGFRIAEPHHDGTPHWHMVLLMRPDVLGTVEAVLRHYAWEPDAAELNTEKKRAARFTAKRVDWEKGIVGYLGKYISKNIDGGKALGEGYADASDEDGETRIPEAAERVRAWASRWGIRQFQQIGGPGVTIWRELRRLREGQDAPTQGELFPFWLAADAGNWHGYIRAMGGTRKPAVSFEVQERWGKPREVILRRRQINKRKFVTRGIRQRRLKPLLVIERRWPLNLFREREAGALTSYGEEAPAAVKGLWVRGHEEPTVTRSHVWTLKFKPAARAPWTRVNNCTRPIESTAAAPWWDDETATATTAKDADGIQLFTVPEPQPELITITNPKERIDHARKSAILARIPARQRAGAHGQFPRPPGDSASPGVHAPG